MSGTCALVVPWHVSGFGYATARSRGCALYRDASRVAFLLGSPPSRGGDLELEGGVSVLVKIWHSTWNTYLVWHLNVVVR